MCVYVWLSPVMVHLKLPQCVPIGCTPTLDKEVATHSSVFAWKIPQTSEPGRIQSMRSQSWT